MLRFSVDIGRRPSPHATVRGGLELFGGNLCHKQSEPTCGGHPYWRRRLLELCVHNRGESGLVDLSIGVRISNMTVRDSLTTTLTSGPRLSAYGTLTAAWVTAGVSSSRTDPASLARLVSTAVTSLSSTGRRNSSVRRFHKLVQSLGRCSPSKRLARTTVQRCRHGGKRVDAVHAPAIRGRSVPTAMRSGRSRLRDK